MQNANLGPLSNIDCANPETFTLVKFLEFWLFTFLEEKGAKPVKGSGPRQAAQAFSHVLLLFQGNKAD